MLEPRNMETEVKFISPRRAADMTSLSTRHLSRLAEAGRFPSPVRLGEGRNGRTAYVESEVLAWNKARLADARRLSKAAA
jgi:predicted DNA-binding transcriptional regulator AlpA